MACTTLVVVGGSTSRKELTEARFKDSRLAYAYHLRVPLTSYILVSEPAKPENEPWLNLAAALKCLFNVQRVSREGARFDKRIFDRI